MNPPGNMVSTWERGEPVPAGERGQVGELSEAKSGSRESSIGPRAGNGGQTEERDHEGTIPLSD